MAKRIRNEDLVDSSNDSRTTGDGTLTIDDLKTQTDADAITAATLPYINASPTPTIKTVVDAISGASNPKSVSLTADGVNTAWDTGFVFDTSAGIPFVVYFNGQEQKITADYAITTPSNTWITFTYIPENTYEIRIVGQLV